MSEVIGKIIAIILILFSAAMVYRLGATAFSNSKVSSATADISSLVLNVQNTYGMQNNFSSLNDTIVAHLAPVSMVEQDSIANPWGGTITGGAEPTNSSQFFILSTNIPNDACSKFAQLASAIKVQINGGTIYNKIDAGQAVLECHSSNNSNTIRFVFGR